MKINGLFLLICIFFGSCQHKEMDQGIAVVVLNPDEAETVKLSDYFDGYRVLTFNDVLCNEITDFVEFPDKYLALAQEGLGVPPKMQIYSFNLQGDLLDTIGSLGRGPGEYIFAGDEIVLNRDSTVMIFDLDKYLNYTSDNKLLYERLYGLGKNREGGLGRPVYLWNDTTIIFYKNVAIGLPAKSFESADMVNVYSVLSEKKVHSFFPCEDVFGYHLHNQLYVFQDTLCFYHEKNGYVYDVFQDQIVPRYKIDKGNYSAETTTKEWLDTHKTRGISMFTMNETDKYVVGIYLYNDHYYYFLFDKKRNVTKNINLIDDDLLKTGIKKSKYFPSSFFGVWHNKIQFPNDYLYFYYSPEAYAKLIERIQSQLSETEWEKYKEEHADLMKIYDGLNEYSNTIILGLKFK